MWQPVMFPRRRSQSAHKWNWYFSLVEHFHFSVSTPPPEFLVRQHELSQGSTLSRSPHRELLLKKLGSISQLEIISQAVSFYLSQHWYLRIHQESKVCQSILIFVTSESFCYKRIWTKRRTDQDISRHFCTLIILFLISRHVLYTDTDVSDFSSFSYLKNV